MFYFWGSPIICFIAYLLYMLRRKHCIMPTPKHTLTSIHWLIRSHPAVLWFPPSGMASMHRDSCPVGLSWFNVCFYHLPNPLDTDAYITFPATNTGFPQTPIFWSLKPHCMQWAIGKHTHTQCPLPILNGPSTLKDYMDTGSRYSIEEWVDFMA